MAQYLVFQCKQLLECIFTIDEDRGIEQNMALVHVAPLLTPMMGYILSCTCTANTYSKALSDQLPFDVKVKLPANPFECFANYGQAHGAGGELQVGNMVTTAYHWCGKHRCCCFGGRLWFLCGSASRGGDGRHNFCTIAPTKAIPLMVHQLPVLLLMR